MFNWFSRSTNKQEACVSERLKNIYTNNLLPLERLYQFHYFHSPQLIDSDFDAKPMILLMGQYSTGKTTFIKYLLDCDFPGMRIGPEPTTDRFIAVMYDDKERIIPGNTLVMDPKKPFRALSKFGNALLNRLQCSLVPSPVLQNVSIIDTPGVLSGDVNRGYDFVGVLEWFAERVDRIILLFDAHKLDISDEFRRSIEALRGYEDKIRIVLNKADMINHQQLMRVYGALMWSLGKILQTPEVARVYIGSFWDQPFSCDINKKLFEDEEQDLFKDLQSLPCDAALRKLNDLIKRTRLAKVHAYIISELQKQMPFMFGKNSKKRELIKNLGQIYYKLQHEHHFSSSDFPDIRKMQKLLENQDFTKFHPFEREVLGTVDRVLAYDFSMLVEKISQEINCVEAEIFIKSKKKEERYDENISTEHEDSEWMISEYEPQNDKIFEVRYPFDNEIIKAAVELETVKLKHEDQVQILQKEFDSSAELQKKSNQNSSNDDSYLLKMTSWKSLLIFIFFQMIGIGALVFYTPNVFRIMFTSIIDTNIYIVVVSVINIVLTFIATVLIDRLEHKVFFYMYSMAVIIILGIIGSYFHYTEIKVPETEHSWWQFYNKLF
ncbi:hypothetical protein ILUMI_22140 [Ignelater luminosus]|uniref:Dynamin-type G domain-containing protein n=1 Tax=Ignelater luminosus TaxID=2038154 RepID=A0A8K0G0T0_IGNLU|nr:hypothetical protein ILUMI_22140 [Ignelater luminosus]